MNEAKIIPFPMQPKIKDQLTQELLWNETELQILLERTTSIRRKLGLPVRQLVVLAERSDVELDGPSLVPDLPVEDNIPE